MSIIFSKEMTFIKIDNDSSRLTTIIDGKPKKIDSISGELVKIGKHSVNFEDEFVEKLDITLVEKDEMYQISVGFHTNLAHTLLNMLATIPLDIESKKLKISSYKKNGYTKIFMLLNNQKVAWRYSPEELGQIEDKSSFFEELFIELEKKFDSKKNEALKGSKNDLKEDVPF